MFSVKFKFMILFSFEMVAYVIFIKSIFQEDLFYVVVWGILLLLTSPETNELLKRINKAETGNEYGDK